MKTFAVTIVVDQKVTIMTLANNVKEAYDNVMNPYKMKEISVIPCRAIEI